MPITVLGDEPVVTQDLTIIMPYIVIIIGSFICLQIVKKRQRDK